MSILDNRFQDDRNQLAATQSQPEQTAGHDIILAQHCWQDLGDSQNSNGLGCLQSNPGIARSDSSDPGLANFDTGNNRIQITGGGNETLRRTDATQVTLNTQDDSEVTDVSGTKVHRAYPGAEPDRYESANGAVLEKRGDKWWVKDKNDTKWNSAGGKIVTYTDGTVQYEGTGLCATQDYNLGAGRASWYLLKGTIGVHANDKKAVYSTQDT